MISEINPGTIVTGMWVCRAGSIRAETGSIWFGVRGDPFDVPVTWLLLDTTSGAWLVDCGFAPDVAKDPVAYLGPSGRRVTFPPNDTLSYRLEEAGIDREQLAGVILTHLHYDHAGGLREVPSTIPIWIHEDELAAYRTDSGRRGYNTRDLEGTHDLRTFRGDQSAISGIDIIETPGHSAGHVSVLVRLGASRYLFSGDAAPTVRNISERLLPGLHVNRPAAERSLDRIIKLVADGAKPIPSHDPNYWHGYREPLRQFVAAY